MFAMNVHTSQLADEMNVCVLDDRHLTRESSLNLSKQQVIQLQQNDSSLVKLFDLARGVKDLQSASRYSLHEGTLVRTWCNKMQPPDTSIMQIVVPTSLRQQLISVAHDQISSGHLGVRTTLDLLQRCFIGLLLILM